MATNEFYAKVDVDTETLTKKLNAISKHLSALADELGEIDVVAEAV